MKPEIALNFMEINCLVTSQDQKEMKEEAVRTLRILIEEGNNNDRINETGD